MTGEAATQVAIDFPAFFTLPPGGRDTIGFLVGEVRLDNMSGIYRMAVSSNAHPWIWQERKGGGGGRWEEERETAVSDR